jgi:hypothetical protein
MKIHHAKRTLAATVLAAAAGLTAGAVASGSRSLSAAPLAAAAGQSVVTACAAEPNEVLEWNRIFIEMLTTTNTPNSSSQRLGAIVQTAVFDAFNGVERRYQPVHVAEDAPPGASRRAAVIAAAYTVLINLFTTPASVTTLDARYAASLDALSDDGDGGQSRARGIAWGTEVAQRVLSWRATDGFALSYPAFRGGTAIGQWRPTPTAFSAMSAQGLAFTDPFVLSSRELFRPVAPRTLSSDTYVEDFNMVKALGRRTGSTRTDEQTALAPFWEGNASVHWNQAANQMAQANCLSISESSRLLAVLNIAMADTAITTWSAKRFYGENPGEVTWRPVTAIPLADLDSRLETTPDLDWVPLITTPAHPEYAAGHPSLNGTAATVLLQHFSDDQVFTLTTPAQPNRSYMSITQARSDGNNARVWGGMHYPSTVRISDETGALIADYINQHAMQRRHPGQ